MKQYSNLPPEQRPAQQLVDRFNADERLWRSLEGKRKRRRKCHPDLSAKRHKRLDQFDFAHARPPQDSVGWWDETGKESKP